MTDLVDNRVDDVLAHYGIPGMKWGRRKLSESSARRKSPGTQEHQEVAAIRSQGKVQGRKSLTNAQMKTAIARMQLEQQYSSLNEKMHPGRFKKIQNRIAKMVGFGKTSNEAYAQATSPAVKAARDGVQEARARAAAGQAIFRFH